MKEKICLAGAALAAIATISAKNAQKLKKSDETKPHNVIFILSDDHRYDFMGFMGKIPGWKLPTWIVWLKKEHTYKMLFAQLH